MSFFGEPTGGVELNELAGERCVGLEEGGRDETAKTGSLVESSELGAGLQEGGEHGGLDLDAAVDGELDFVEDLVELLFFVPRGWVP